jgi:nucleotide sugar dehydrogenase
MTPDRHAAAAGLCRALDARIARWAVIGLGYMGSATMRALLAAGFEVHGFDRSAAAVERFRGAEPTPPSAKPWSVGTDESVIATADVVLIAVRVLRNADGTSDLEPLLAAAETVRRWAREPRLVLVESTVPPGTTRRLAADWLKLDPAGTTLVAHFPERLQSGGSPWTLANTPHLVGGVDAAATLVARHAVSTICPGVVAVSAPEVSELAKLLENAFLSTGIALVGEITRLAHRLDVEAGEVTAAAASKPFGYYAFHAGPGIGGHCLPNDLEMLRETAGTLGLPSPLLDGAAELAGELPGMVVARLEQLLQRRGETVAGGRILLVGVGFKIGSDDTTASPALDISRLLKRRGAVPVFLDHQVEALWVDGTALERATAQTLRGSRFRAALILSGDSSIGGVDIEAVADLLLDAGGGRILQGAPANAYRL